MAIKISAFSGFRLSEPGAAALGDLNLKAGEIVRHALTVALGNQKNQLGSDDVRAARFVARWFIFSQDTFDQTHGFTGIFTIARHCGSVRIPPGKAEGSDQHQCRNNKNSQNPSQGVPTFCNLFQRVHYPVRRTPVLT